ncbi:MULTISPECIES: 1,2-phenylacetyl-CoA epoxidase subunit PaaC [Sphingomonadales]|jgi:ring-1,2-phenylacetyl-CoA epoxidase subunit PaaC|uniref:Phenylacetate-CoA oxygenase, PaaI subunit n=1 Tax=Rhizorhabdus wittichii (strain DSM 6014 / CCUG 31198 / JCM 15750 / NBRC 105917 / EY 4224 / RW1) TaxID=392499 RepID=A0A9J9H934_RHIWR|nr:phenylacetate-CoA oxygenase, PaaI subunit [Rhizorhabdus wittichii RW1]
MSDILFRSLLELGDDSLILAQRLCEWCGQAPSVEVDLSLSNLGLDLMGQATLFLGYAGEVEGKGRDADRLAFHRDAEQFRNCLLVEQPNGDFGQTMARQFLFSTYQLALFEGLVGSTDPRIAEIAAKAVKEVRYHADISADWVIRLGDGTEESHQRMVDGFDWFWRFIDDMFAVDADQRALIDQGVLVDRAALRPAFDARVAEVLAEATLPAAEPVWQVGAGREGRHTEHLSHLLGVMQQLPRAHPEAAW